MADPQQTLGGGTNARPLHDTLAETGPGLPDEAIGPDQRSLSEQTDLADNATAGAIESKLRREAGVAEEGEDGAELDGV